jgi:hypothetical protein
MFKGKLSYRTVAFVGVAWTAALLLVGVVLVTSAIKLLIVTCALLKQTLFKVVC